jgi:hypothetical protein
MSRDDVRLLGRWLAICRYNCEKFDTSKLLLSMEACISLADLSFCRINTSLR